MGWGNLLWLVLIAYVIGRRPGKLRRAAGILVLWLTLSTAYAIVALLVKDAQAMGSIEHYDLSGWYEILEPGFAVAMWFLLAGVVVVRLYRLARWGVKRLIENRRSARPSSY